MYKEVIPSANLSKTIDSFWIFSDDQDYNSFNILPDSCTDLIFDLNQNKGFVSGIMSKSVLVESTSKSHLIGIRFKAEKFRLLSNIPLNQTKNLRIEFSELIGSKDADILCQFYRSNTEEEKVNLLEKFVSETLIQNEQKENQLILSVSNKIRTLKGKVNVKDLAKSHNISLRQLQRCFKEYIGLSIKEFASVIRFNNTIKAIKSNPGKSLMELAFDMGFYDHAHMNYEFQRITGKNPSQFR